MKLKKNNKNSFFINNVSQEKKFILFLFNIILKFLQSDKKLFFVGFPDVINKILIKLYINNFINNLPKELWMNGLLTNYVNIYYNFLNTKKLKFLSNKSVSNLKNFNYFIPDIIIIYDYNNYNNLIKECHSLKIPFIFIDSNVKLKKNIFFLKIFFKYINKIINN